jgi:hypothetical protein
VGLFKAVLDAVLGSDDQIAGQRFTRLSSPLAEGETADMFVESTLGFGEETDGTSDARLLVGGEIVAATGRTAADPFKFTGLTRGEEATTDKLHPVGEVVWDLSQNATALDRVRRGILVRTAVGEDLDVVGRNLGLRKCPGITESEWREIIKAVAYVPKQTLDAMDRALTALLGSGNYAIKELPSDPWKVFVEALVALSTSVRGRFLLNGGEAQLTTGALTVDTTYDVIGTSGVDGVFGVYDDTPMARRGYRSGTNYSTTSTFAGKTITLDASPGAAGTPVLVDYTAFQAHYLAADETIRDDGDRYAYLADPLAAARCLLGQIRAAGVKVDVVQKL